VKNALTNPVTLTFDLWTLNRVSQVDSLYQVWTLWDHSFLCYAADKQTDNQTDRQTDRQTDCLENPTHAGEVNDKVMKPVYEKEAAAT